MRARLPLFPLGTVLFPGLLLPLHVFEERYRLLVRELTALPEGPERRFGVVAIRRGREVGTDGVPALYEVGCTAEVRRVTPYDDGRFDLVTGGVTRFRLLEVDDSRPYLSAEVELLPEEAGAESAVVATAVTDAFTRYLDLVASVRGTEVGRSDLPDDPLLLSYLVAATTMLDLADRQALLAEPDAGTRLRHELRLLHRELTMLGRLRAAPATDLSTGTSPN